VEVHHGRTTGRGQYRWLGGIAARGRLAAREAVLCGLPLRIVSAADLLPRMLGAMARRTSTTAHDRQVGVGIGDPARSAAALASAFEEASRKSRGLVRLVP
jgi:hypothetical protein